MILRIVQNAEIDGRRFVAGREVEAPTAWARVLLGMGIAEPVRFGAGREAARLRALVEENWRPGLCYSAPMRTYAKAVPR